MYEQSPVNAAWMDGSEKMEQRTDTAREDPAKEAQRTLVDLLHMVQHSKLTTEAKDPEGHQAV